MNKHELDHKLDGHPIVGRLDVNEVKFFAEITVNTTLRKNILMTLTRKILDNITNIKQVYNVRHINKKVINGRIIEI